MNHGVEAADAEALGDARAIGKVALDESGLRAKVLALAE